MANLIPFEVMNGLKDRLREVRRLQGDLIIDSMHATPGRKLENDERITALALEEITLHDTIRDLSPTPPVVLRRFPPTRLERLIGGFTPLAAAATFSRTHCTNSNT